MIDKLKEIKYSLLLLLGILASLLTVIIPLLLIEFLNFRIITYILTYYFITFLLWKIFRKRVFQILLILPLLPFYFLFEILTYTIPINLILINVFLFLAFPIILITYSSIALSYFKIPINYELKLYLSLLFTYLFYVTFNKIMLKFVANISPARYKNSKKLKPYNIKEISEYLISQDNMKIVIYTFNFLAIIFINIYKFQNFNFYDKIPLFEKPILQSLVTFIAFDRVITLFKNLNFKPSELFNKILLGIKSKKESIK